RYLLSFPTRRSSDLLQSAMKQSLRTQLPKLNSLRPLNDFLQGELPGLKFIAHCGEGDKMELKRVAQSDRDITVLIGPEGDFTKEIGKHTSELQSREK